MQTFPLTTQMMLMQSNNHHCHSETTISGKTILGMYLALILITLAIDLFIAVRLYFTGYNNFFKDYIYELYESITAFLFNALTLVFTGLIAFIILGEFIGTLL